LDPLLLELPLRANEASALAEVVFQQVEGKRLTDDLRNRAAGRAELLGLETIVPYLGSLQADPNHPNSYFLAVDAVRGGVVKPYLLRLASASAPSSGLFQKSILIGRMRPGGGREIVINAVPFAAEQQEEIRTFAQEIDRFFLPKPCGAALSISSPDANAFTDFKKILNESNLNVAACAGEWHAGVLGAIRAGWRDGYSIASSALVLRRDTDALDEVLKLTGYTKLVLDVSGIDPESRKVAVSEVLDASIKANAAQQWTWKRPDLEISWQSAGMPTQPGEITALTSQLRETGRAVQSVSPFLSEDWLETVQAVRETGAVLALDSSQPNLQQIARACGGRVHCRAQPGEDTLALFKRLRG
jgi:hypothetical protein